MPPKPIMGFGGGDTDDRIAGPLAAMGAADGAATTTTTTTANNQSKTLFDSVASSSPQDSEPRQWWCLVWLMMGLVDLLRRSSSKWGEGKAIRSRGLAGSGEPLEADVFGHLLVNCCRLL